MFTEKKHLSENYFINNATLILALCYVWCLYVNVELEVLAYDKKGFRLLTLVDEGEY